jgi:hypothetical protein
MHAASQNLSALIANIMLALSYVKVIAEQLPTLASPLACAVELHRGENNSAIASNLRLVSLFGDQLTSVYRIMEYVI